MATWTPRSRRACAKCCSRPRRIPPLIHPISRRLPIGPVAAQDPAAREALSVFFRTTRFLPVDPASQQALDDLRRGVTRVREQLE